MMTEQEIRETLVEYGKKVVETNLVQGTWGNLSLRLDDRYMMVTPSGLDYTRLTPADMVKVELGTLRYEGARKPTSEKGLHDGIYRRRADVGAIIHTHSTYCSVFAAARKDVPIFGEEMEKIFGAKVALAKYAAPGTKKLWVNTMAALGENSGCIMANHGMLCTGKTMAEAFLHCEMLEEYCRSYILSCIGENEDGGEVLR